MNVLRILILPLLLLPMLLSAQEKDMAKDSTIYTTVEQMPQFPGGEAEMNKYIRDNLRFSNDSTCSSFIRVTARFVVEKDGSIKDIKILRGVCPSHDRAVVDLVKGMPYWIPGKQNGREARVYYTLPIRICFR
ncbi:energy transducer TonB [Dysgonomonas sp. 25]|uniref:energy transducer TonB n=1 Tax=Dysgonomonas sp. 25 TaxID=2302933 RepID=UPI0013D53F69|nr:energy transducer TonB [Dysgonomonas sp. 25]